MKPKLAMDGRMVAFAWIVSLSAALSIKAASAQPPTPKFDGQSVEQWIDVLEHGNLRNRVQAAKALGALGRHAPEVVEPLTAALEDESPQVRRAAVISLGLTGSAASSALPALKTLENDRDEQVRRVAASVVRRLVSRPQPQPTPQPAAEPSIASDPPTDPPEVTPEIAPALPLQGRDSEMVVAPEGVLFFKDRKLELVIPKTEAADAAFQEHRYAVAADGYSKALAWAESKMPGARNQQVLDVYLKRARANQALGNTDQMLSDLHSMVYLPESKEIDWDGAGHFSEDIIKFATAIIEQRSSDPRAYELRGAMYSREHKNEEALADYSKLIELTRGNASAQADAYALRAQIYMNLEQFELAMRDVQQGLTLYPSEECYFRRALLHEMTKNYPLAIIDLTMLLKRVDSSNPRYSVYLETRARIFRQMNDPAAALKDLNRLLELEPKNLAARGERVLVYYELGQGDLAEVEWERLKKDASSFAEQLQVQVNEIKTRR